MKLFKKWICTVLFAALLMSSVQVFTYASTSEIEASGICGDSLTWTLSTDRVLTLKGTGPMYDYEYERQYNIYGEVEFSGPTTPWSKYGIKKIIVEEGVTTIGDYGFYGCCPTDVQLPDTLTSIGESSFSFMGGYDTEGGYYYGLTSLALPEGLVNIGDKAFYWTESLKTIYFPSTLRSIGNRAFDWCFLSDVHIPDMESWCAIDFDVGYGNPLSLSSNGKLYVGGQLITDVVIPYGVTTIKGSQFHGYSAMTSIQIPNTVTRLEAYAFSLFNRYNGDGNLTSVTIPASVNYIGEGVFGDQRNLEKIVILNPDCEIESNMYYNNEWEIPSEGIYATHPVIYGYAGSTAEIYAKAKEYEFVALTDYEIISGGNSTVKVGDCLTIVSNGDFSAFESVAIDGLTVDASDYMVSSGSTVIEFSKEFISALTAGEHSVTVFFADGIASTSMTVASDLRGDITGDGNVNMGDVAKLYAHIKGTSVFTDENALARCDITGDGNVNMGDVAKLYAYVKGTSKLY